MHPLRKFGPAVSVLFALLTIGGCGGGSGGSMSSNINPGGQAALNVYVTDAFSDSYKQVLVTLYKIELTTDGKTYQTVFSETAGRTVDLSSLAATAELLAMVTVPTGSYTQARITFGDHVILVSPSGTSTSVAVDPSLGTDTSGQIAITLPTPTSVHLGQTAALLVDFKLAEFKLTGGVLRPQIRCGGEGDIGNKQRTGHLRGTVASLTATGFTLQGPDGHTVSVVLSSSTLLSGGQSGTALILSNGQNVDVEGAFDAATQTVTATSVTLNGGMEMEHPQADGTIASIDAANNRFVLTVERTDGFQPTGGTVTVQTDASTHFGKGEHQPGAFTDITTGVDVHVDGTFDTSTQTLTAKFVGLH